VSQFTAVQRQPAIIASRSSSATKPPLARRRLHLRDCGGRKTIGAIQFLGVIVAGVGRYLG